MSRKIMVGGEEKGDWFDAVLSWASPAKPSKPSTTPPPAPPPPVSRTRAIKTREQILPVSGPSEPHTVIAPEPVMEVDEPPAPSTPTRVASYHSCGHLSWASPEQDEAARAEGKCCGNWKYLPNWSVRGLTSPVPKGHQRSPEKEGGMGWPGLCCDPKTGLYIGGVGNDCRYYHNGPERCIVHSVTVSKYTKTADAALPADMSKPDEPDPNDELDFMGATPEEQKPKSAGGKKGSRRG